MSVRSEWRTSVKIFMTSHASLMIIAYGLKLIYANSRYEFSRLFFFFFFRWVQKALSQYLKRALPAVCKNRSSSEKRSESRVGLYTRCEQTISATVNSDVKINFRKILRDLCGGELWASRSKYDCWWRVTAREMIGCQLCHLRTTKLSDEKWCAVTTLARIADARAQNILELYM